MQEYTDNIHEIMKELSRSGLYTVLKYVHLHSSDKLEFQIIHSKDDWVNKQSGYNVHVYLKNQYNYQDLGIGTLGALNLDYSKQEIKQAIKLWLDKYLPENFYQNFVLFQ